MLDTGKSSLSIIADTEITSVDARVAIVDILIGTTRFTGQIIRHHSDNMLTNEQWRTIKKDGMRIKRSVEILAGPAGKLYLRMFHLSTNFYVSLNNAS
jgi:hypothetical protein